MSIHVILKLLLVHLVTDEGAHGTHFVAVLVLCHLFFGEAREGCQAVLALGYLVLAGTV